MSLQDESFPEDGLFDKLNATAASQGQNQCHSLQRQFSIGLHIDEPDNFERHASPFLNSDCSEKTCASDPVGLQHENEHEHEHELDEVAKHGNNNDAGETGHHAHTHLQVQLGSGRSSKSVSYQDIHSAYTKRRYKHVTSKVSKYIADLHDQEKQRRSAAGTFQRHRSMPESLTPRGGAEDQQKLDESMSLANSSGTDTNVRDESYERLIDEKERLQSYSDYLEAKLYKKIDDNIVLKKNFEAIRTELTDCKDKLKRQAANTLKPANATHSLRSLMYGPPVLSGGVTKATQTDLPAATAHTSHLSDLSDMPAIAANATPHPNANLNDITYDSSAGSIEIPLLSVPPAVNQRLAKANAQLGNLKPLSLNFSSNSGDVEATGVRSGAVIAGSLQPTCSNQITTNNSGSSHPSSNDSAIDIEAHELRSPQPVNFGLVRDWGQRAGLIYYDKHNNRVIELVPLNGQQAPTSSVTGGQFGVQHIGHRKRSLASRMLRLLGPCARCDDLNQMDASNATYTVGIPLLADESNRSHNMR